MKIARGYDFLCKPMIEGTISLRKHKTHSRILISRLAYKNPVIKRNT
jgi:hypothetical protein